MTQFHLRTVVEYFAVSTYLLAAFALIGAPVKLALRAFDVPVRRAVSAPLIGISIVVLSSWYWASPFGGTRPVARILLGASAVIVVATIAWHLVRTREGRLAAIRRELVASNARLLVLAFLGIGCIVVVTQTQFFTRDHFTVLSLGNSDAASYALQAQHLLDHGPKDPGHLTGFDVGHRTLEFSGGAYAVLAGSASLTGLDVWKAMQPTFIVALVVASHSLALLVRAVTKRSDVLCASLGLIGFGTCFVVYVTGHWFFSQYLGMGIVLAVTAALVLAVRSGLRRDRVGTVAMLGVLFGGGFWAYPHMVVLGSVALLPVVAVDASSVRSTIRRAVATAVIFAGAFLVGIVLAPGLFIDAIRTTRELGDVEAGWPLPAIYPNELLGFQTNVSAKGTMASMVVSVLLLAAVLTAAVFAFRRGLRATVLPLATILVVVLGSYLIIYQREGGPTYRQWKWIVFFAPLFVAAFCGVVLLAAEAAKRFPAIQRAAALGVGAYAVVVLLLSTSAGVSESIATPRGWYSEVSLDQINLDGTPALRGIDQINVDVNEYWESMWMAYFLRDKQIYLARPTYYPSASPIGDIWLQRNDSGAPTADFEMVAVLNDTYRLVRKR